MTAIKELRLSKGLTQNQAAKMVGISLRSYNTYENDEDKKGSMKYNYIIDKISAFNSIDEEHGVLDLETIKRKCTKILSSYKAEYCYIFGSYAKGQATPESDVDLLVSSDVKGLKFYGMVEEIRIALNKKVDVLDLKQLQNNWELTQEILKDGIKIYG